MSPYPNNCKISNERVNGLARCPQCGLEAGWRCENLALWMDHRRASLKKRSGQFLKGVQVCRENAETESQSLLASSESTQLLFIDSRVKETNQMRSMRGYSRRRRKETQLEDSGAEHTSEHSLMQIQETNWSCYLPKNAKTERSTL